LVKYGAISGLSTGRISFNTELYRFTILSKFPTQRRNVSDDWNTSRAVGGTGICNCLGVY
jgi:hypothetical protein